jgi:hypothetical protein
MLVDADVSEKQTVSIFQGWSDKAPNKSTTHSGKPWKGPFPSLSPPPTQAPPWNLTVGSLLVRIPVPYSFPPIGSFPSALALLYLYKPAISLPFHFSPGRWRQYVFSETSASTNISAWRQNPKIKKKTQQNRLIVYCITHRCYRLSRNSNPFSLYFAK